MTLDDLVPGSKEDPHKPELYRQRDGFFIFMTGRRRQFGWCCGRLGFSYRYTAFLIEQARKATFLSWDMQP